MPAACPLTPTLDDHLCFAVYAAGHAFARAYRPLLAPLGLTYPQYLVLLVLWQEDAIAIGEIGLRLGLDSGTLTPLLKRMERAGLLRRQRSPADERRVEVRLTDAGQALRAKVAGIREGIGGALGCSLGEAGGLKAGLDRLRRNLDTAMETAT